MYDQAKKDKLRLQMLERALSKKLITPNYYREAKAILTGASRASIAMQPLGRIED